MLPAGAHGRGSYNWYGSNLRYFHDAELMAVMQVAMIDSMLS